MKKELVYKIMSFVVMSALVVSSLTVTQAKQGNFCVMKQGIRLQYVPVGNGSNCFSHHVDLYDGQQLDVKLLINKDDSVDASTVMTNHLLNATLLQDATGDFTISLKNTKIITSAGAEISMAELDGWYDIKGENALTGTTVAALEMNDYTAGDLINGYFYSTIAVSFDETTDTESNHSKLAGLAEVEGTLPADCFYKVEDNVIQLIDFTLDGTLTIKGNEIHESVILVVRGDCDITNLVIECPVTVRRYAYASLCGNNYTIIEGNTLSFDNTYNATVLKTDNEGYEIGFDNSIAEANMTQGELDEKNNTYNFAWRSRKSEWYQKAVSDIESLRNQTVSVKVVEADGKQVTDAQVNFSLEDYDYYFGSASTGAGLDANNQWEFYHNPTLKENITINYDEFAWENYDKTYEGDQNNTYSFDYVSLGNTNYHRDRAEFLKKNGVTVVAQPLIYPSVYAMSDLYNRENLTVPNALKAYIFSDEYTPEGFHQMIKDHIAEEITSYAGYIYVWALVNEEYYYNEFFQLIYGVDDEENGFTAGNGLSKEQIAIILENAQVSNEATDDDKMEILRTYLKERELIPAQEAGRIVCSWAEVAQGAWDATITEGCGYTSDDLILYCNDACWKGDTTGNEAGHYTYFLDYATALSDPNNYVGGKVLIEMMGLQMASFSYQSTPMEVIDMLNDLEDVDKQLLVTEANYWVDNPYTDTGVDDSNYGYGPEKYLTSDILSQAEKEFAYDYAYYMMTALYSHPSSVGIHWVGYSSGQIGGRYQGGDGNGITPIGYAYRDLTMKEWNASETIRVTSAESVSTTLPCGTYMATIKRDGKVYFEKTFVSNETNEVVITLSEPVINQKECISATLYEDASYSKVKEALGKFESIKEVNDAVSGKTGYLLVNVMDNVNMDSLSDATLSEIKIQISDNKAITLSGTNILLPCDLVIKGDIVVADSGATINGANHKVTILADGEETKISGGKLTTNHLSMIIGGEGYVSVLAEIADLEELSVACLEDGYTLNVSDVDDAWAHIEHNAQLLIQAEVSGVKQLNLYGKDVYISGEGSLEADNVSGIYGNIYLQKKEDGTLSSFGVTSTMEDMVWQIRLLLYSQLEKGEAQISASDLADSCVQGTVLAYVPSDAHSTVAEKLGFVKKVSGIDNWDDYGKKTLLDGRLYFDDGSSAIDHAWEDAYTTDEAATCVSGGRESVHCKYCDLTKNSREIPATGKHDIYDEEGNLLTEVSHCSGCGVKNIAYENISLSAKTAVYTGKPLTAEITGIDAGYYDVEGNVQTDAGTYHIVLTGKNGYDGARTILWTIKKQTLSASSLNKPVLTANCGDKLSDVSLSGTGFVWIAPGEVLTAGSEAGGATVTKTAKYIPADMNNYNEVSGVALQIAVKHKWDAGSVMRKPTAANTGIMKYSCSGCGNTRTEPIPALGLPKINSKVKDEAKKATYRVTKSDLKNGTVTYLAPTNKKVTNVTIPATIRINGVSFKVTAIEKNAFKANKKLKTVTIGKNISSIGDYAFYKCTALTKITIPSKVKTIGKKAFYGCSKVTTLTIKTTKLTSQKIGSKAFAKTRKSMIVKLPKKKFAAYKAILIKKGVNKKAKFKKS